MKSPVNRLLVRWRLRKVFRRSWAELLELTLRYIPEEKRDEFFDELNSGPRS